MRCKGSARAFGAVRLPLPGVAWGAAAGVGTRQVYCVQYYLRSVEVYPSRASARRPPHAAARGVVVEYMDRARGATVDIFAQTLTGTLSTTAKLSYLTNFFMRNTRMPDCKRARKTSIRGLSLQHQLPCDVSQVARSKTRTVQGIPACKPGCGHTPEKKSWLVSFKTCHV